jgi:hypothetical protein
MVINGSNDNKIIKKDENKIKIQRCHNANKGVITRIKWRSNTKKAEQRK